MSRATEYTEGRAERILEQVRAGVTTRGLVAAELISDPSIIYAWLHQFPDFLKQYKEAQEISAYAHENQMAEVIEDTLSGELDPAAARVVLGGLKHVASVKHPRRHNEKLIVAGAGEVERTIIINQLLPDVPRETIEGNAKQINELASVEPVKLLPPPPKPGTESQKA